MTDQSKETELKPCPFCGSANVSVDTKYQDRLNDGWGCTCLEDKCHGGIFVVDAFYPTRADAVTAWNTRTPDTAQLLKEKEEMRGALHRIKANAHVFTTRRGAGIDGEEKFDPSKVLAEIRAIVDDVLIARLSPQEQEEQS